MASRGQSRQVSETIAEGQREIVVGHRWISHAGLHARKSSQPRRFCQKLGIQIGLLQDLVSRKS